MRYGLAGLLLCVVCISPMGCGGSAKQVVKPGPGIPGVNLSGRWYSTEFGDMKVVQSGVQFSGQYFDRRGPDHNGRFRGQIIGDLIRLDWIKPGNALAAVMPRRGRAWLRIKERGQVLSGRWGYDQSNDDGGIWTAEKSTNDMP